jgi:hypothetical protein
MASALSSGTAASADRASRACENGLATDTALGAGRLA